MVTIVNNELNFMDEFKKLNNELDEVLIRYSKKVCPDCRIKLLKSKIKLVKKYGRMIK